MPFRAILPPLTLHTDWGSGYRFTVRRIDDHLSVFSHRILSTDVAWQASEAGVLHQQCDTVDDLLNMSTLLFDIIPEDSLDALLFDVC